MNHDFLDVPFWVQWEDEYSRRQYSVCVDCDLEYDIERCLSVVCNQTPPEELRRRTLLSPGRVVSLFKTPTEEKPFATARLNFQVKLQYRLDLLSETKKPIKEPNT